MLTDFATWPPSALESIIVDVSSAIHKPIHFKCQFLSEFTAKLEDQVLPSNELQNNVVLFYSFMHVSIVDERLWAVVCIHYS